ncbi:MAG TPA: proline--tRNA ligase [Alphaproteobacteria bacterium]|nr:proline--tRNA ligase [Alphaproteobacteria bacterium]
MAEAAQKQKNSKTAITPTREENFPEWYQQVIKAADMAENAPVRGCMIIKPYGFAMWENVQKHLDGLIKNEDVQNAYFPLLIPMSYIAREAEHIDGFAKECAVVTHHRLSVDEKTGQLGPDKDSVLSEPMIIRPTSETIIGESMKNWVQSYRDLPLKLNQWCNIMRWEMRPRIFLRTAEFLWQEGHNAFATAEEADADARRMLDVYNNMFENYLAIATIPGAKTPEERFPGAIETYTLETFMQDGKALQGCTSHNLGQTFARSCDIKYLDKDGTQKLAWTTSWGFTTRTIGASIMVHADDDGMVMAPMVAPHQVVILPFINDDADRAKILEACDNVKRMLHAAGISARVDASEARSSDKMWTAIKKGVPVRLEIGARELAEGQVVFTRRDLGKDGKMKVSIDSCAAEIGKALQQMQKDLLARSRARLASQITDVKTLKDVRDYYAADKTGGLRLDYALVKDSPEFAAIAKEYAVTTRCLPFADGGEKVIVAKSY